jgi:hypothetical protein
LLAALALVLMPWIAFSQDAATAPAESGNPLEPILNMLAPVLAGLLGRYGWVSQVLLIIGVLRVCFKPVMIYLEQRAKDSPGTEDDERLANFERGPIYKAIAFLLDFGGSIKLPTVTKTLNQGTMKTLLMMAALVVLIGCSTGCKTGADGKRTVDVAKLDSAKAAISPIAAGTVRRILQNSPEHAPKIAKYVSSFAGVFCTMNLSNSFSPDFLITETDRLFDPDLEQIGDGYVLDIKNGVVSIYRLLWGDRLRAEIPPDQWLHKVCEFVCESLNQGLTDAGYPGGVKRTTSNYRRDLYQRMNLSADQHWPLIREPEADSAAVLPTRHQAPPASDVWELARQ